MTIRFPTDTSLPSGHVHSQFTSSRVSCHFAFAKTSTVPFATFSHYVMFPSSYNSVFTSRFTLLHFTVRSIRSTVFVFHFFSSSLESAFPPSSLEVLLASIAIRNVLPPPTTAQEHSVMFPRASSTTKVIITSYSRALVRLLENFRRWGGGSPLRHSLLAAYIYCVPPLCRFRTAEDVFQV